MVPTVAVTVSGYVPTWAVELTCTLSWSVTLPLAGRAGAEGLKAHVAPLGRFEHCKLTLPVSPSCELRVMVKLVDCPTETVAEAGEMAPLKSGPWTWSVAA